MNSKKDKAGKGKVNNKVSNPIKETPSKSKELASKDVRFSAVLSNPIFRSVPKREKKINIDKRFESMFHDESFKLKYKTDKRGRPVNLTTDDNLKKYYNLEEEEEDEENDNEEEEKPEVESEEEDDEPAVKSENEDDGDEITPIKSESESDVSSDVEIKEEDDQSSIKVDPPQKLSQEVRKKLRSSEVDYARGEASLVSEGSSDDDSTSEAEEEEPVDHDWGEMDKDAPRTEDVTRRLALCNMDWDRVKASDLMVLFSSFLPPGGVLSKASIYPSEFGKARIAEEDLKGPLELQQFKEEYASDEEFEEKNEDDSDNEEGSEFNREKLRKYQLNRLKYYYAVLEFNDAASADKVYSECDGMEYESSAAKIDLRFIPDEMEFDEIPKDTCGTVPEASKYRPKFFTTTALQQVKVACTWDETDPTRKEIIDKVMDPKEKVDEEDLRAYLASSSSESDDDEAVDEDGNNPGKSTDDPIAKYRMLLESIEKKEESKKKDVELEITWGVGLKQKAQELVKKKSKEEEVKKLTPWEERLVKQKEKRRQKKAGNVEEKEPDSEDDSDAEQQLFSDDDVDVDMNDPFFKEEMDKVKQKSRKTKGKKDKDKLETEIQEDEKSKGDLDLLLMDDASDSKKHFNFKKIVESELTSKSKRKRMLQKRKKSNVKEDKPDDFEVDVQDERFSSLFTSHHFNIDPSEPNFKKTKAMETIIQAKQKRRERGNNNANIDKGSVDESQFIPEKRKAQAELSYLVNSIKNKTKANKKNLHKLK